MNSKKVDNLSTHTCVPPRQSDQNCSNVRRSPPPFLRNPGNASVLARHKNQSKIHNRRNHSTGSKRMRGNKTAAVRSHVRGNKTAAVRSHVGVRLLLNGGDEIGSVGVIFCSFYI